MRDSGGEEGIRTLVGSLIPHPISSRRRYDHFGTSPRGGNAAQNAAHSTFIRCAVKACRLGRGYNKALLKTNRARHTKRMRVLHAKIKNIRHHTLHEFTTKLVKKYAAIFVGDVNAKGASKNPTG